MNTNTHSNNGNGCDPTFIKVFVMHGGKIPEKADSCARGHDAYVAGIVTPRWDAVLPCMRQRLWDFKSEPHVLIEKNAVWDPQDPDKSVYLLHPNESIMIGLGVAFGMSPGWCAWTARRSSTALRRLHAVMDPKLLGAPDHTIEAFITDWMEGVPVDAGFNAEPLCYLENHGNEDFPIAHGQRVTQLLFNGPNGNFDPVFERVATFAELGKSARGNNHNGSTGHFEIKHGHTQLDFTAMTT